MTRDRRESLRFETCFLVKVQSTEHGITHCVARNVSEGGVFLETSDPLPLGAAVRVWFSGPSGHEATVSVVGEVKNHFFLQYASGDRQRSLTGMGVRFVKFEEPRNEEIVMPAETGPNATIH